MIHHWITREDRELHAVEHGPSQDDAPATVVLVHGYALGSGIFGPMARILAAGGVRVVRPDLAGHGWSRAGEQPLDLDVLADDLAAVLRSLHVPEGRPLVLVGHSMGGMVLMRVLARHEAIARRVDAMVWLATSPGGMASSPFGLPVRAGALVGPLVGQIAPRVMARAARSGPDVRPAPRGGAREVELAHLARSNFHRRPSRSTLRQVQAMHHRVPYRVLAELLTSVLAHDGRDALRSLDCRGLVLIGDDDRMTPLAHSEEIAALHRGSTLQVVPAAGHLLMVEHPHDMAGAVLQLVRECA